MSSAQLSMLISLRQSDYVALAVLTIVGYDYTLTFSDEVEYIWNKPWSFVSTLFLFVRYLGLSNLITCVLLGSSFVANFEKSQGEAIYIINAWVFYLFLGAADCVMSLRVWAVYNRSRLIFGILLTILLLELISSLVRAATDSNPKNVSAPVIRIMDDSFCVVMSIPVWLIEGIVFQMLHGVALCLLLVVRFVKHSIQMYCARKQWQPNRYINLFVTQGIFYFLALFLYDIIIMLAAVGMFPRGGWQLIVLTILNYVPVFTLTPRFIISIRKLYARGDQARCNCNEEIDTGFGLSVSISDGSRSAVVFADIEQSGGLEEPAIEEVDAVQAV